MTLGVLAPLFLLAPLWAQETSAPPDFATEIQPILVHNCRKCHGPDEQKGGPRLDTRAAALHGGDSSDHVLVSGKSAGSELLLRLRSNDPDFRMPPKGKRVAPEQIELLRRWIDAGAPWPEDWRVPFHRELFGGSMTRRAIQTLGRVVRERRGEKRRRDAAKEIGISPPTLMRG